MRRKVLTLLTGLILSSTLQAQSGPGSLQLPTRSDIPEYQIKLALTAAMAFADLTEDVARRVTLYRATGDDCKFTSIDCKEAYDLLKEMSGLAYQIGTSTPLPKETAFDHIQRLRKVEFNRIAYIQWKLAKEAPQGIGFAVPGVGLEVPCEHMYMLYWRLLHAFVVKPETFTEFAPEFDSVDDGTDITPYSLHQLAQTPLPFTFQTIRSLEALMQFYSIELQRRLEAAGTTSHCLLAVDCSEVGRNYVGELLRMFDHFDSISQNTGNTPAETLQLHKGYFLDAIAVRQLKLLDIMLLAPNGRGTDFSSTREATQGLFQTHWMMVCQFIGCAPHFGSSGGGRDD